MSKVKNIDEYTLDDWLHITEWLIDTVDEISYCDSLADTLALVSNLITTGAKPEKKIRELKHEKYPLKKLAMQMKSLQVRKLVSFPEIWLATNYSLTLKKGNQDFITLTNTQWFSTDRHIYYGRLLMNGKIQFSNNVRQMDRDLIRELLEVYNEAPALYAKVISKKTGECIYCRKMLVHPTSLSVGYDATCARHYGLQWAASETGIE